jgi:hypothetical protein
MKSLTRLVFGTGILMCVFMMSSSNKTVAAGTGPVVCQVGPCNLNTGFCTNGGPQLGCVCAGFGGVTQGCF